jgi:hypothetical protein
VCFATPVVIEYVTVQSELSTDEQSSVWWHQDDIDDFLKNALKNSTDAMKHKLLMDGLDRALHNSRPQHALKLNHDEKYDEYLRTVQEDRGLTLWCRYGHSRRGLERVCSRLHFESRAYAAEKGRAEIVRLSRASVDKEELRQVSERCAFFAKVFARMIAEADAIAARTLDSFDTEEGQSTQKQTRRNTQPCYSGNEDNNVPSLISIPTLITQKSMRRWSA